MIPQVFKETIDLGDGREITIETGKRVVSTKGRSEDIRVHIVNKDALDSRIAGITQHGRII